MSSDGLHALAHDTILSVFDHLSEPASYRRGEDEPVSLRAMVYRPIEMLDEIGDAIAEVESRRTVIVRSADMAELDPPHPMVGDTLHFGDIRVSVQARDGMMAEYQRHDHTGRLWRIHTMLAPAPLPDPAPETLTVTGTLSPDATGEYQQWQEFNGQQAWRRDADDFYIIYSTDQGRWLLVQSSAITPETVEADSDSIFTHAETGIDAGPAGTYNPAVVATGTATVSEE